MNYYKKINWTRVLILHFFFIIVTFLRKFLNWKALLVFSIILCYPKMSHENMLELRTPRIFRYLIWSLFRKDTETQGLFRNDKQPPAFVSKLEDLHRPISINDQSTVKVSRLTEVQTLKLEWLELMEVWPLKNLRTSH